MTAWYLLAAVLLLLANAFFVAVEFALVTSRRERLEQLAEGGRRTARSPWARRGSCRSSSPARSSG